MIVAAVQFCPVFKDFLGNIHTMGELAKQAAGQGAELIVFPEMATTGYSFMSEAEAQPFAEPMLVEKGSSISLDHMSNVAELTGAALVWGFIEKAGGALYNSQCFVTPEGQVTTYRKRNLWGNDYLWAAKGDINPSISMWKNFKVGLLICRDIRDKNEVTDEIYEPGDADIVAFSSNFGDGGFPSGTWVDFAINNQVTLVVSNRYGQEANNNFGEGGICVITPQGKVHCDGLVWSQTSIVYHDVPSVVRRARPYFESGSV